MHNQGEQTCLYHGSDKLLYPLCKNQEAYCLFQWSVERKDHQPPANIFLKERYNEKSNKKSVTNSPNTVPNTKIPLKSERNYFKINGS